MPKLEIRAQARSEFPILIFENSDNGRLTLKG